MNIYLDIDGVLLANDKHPANYVAEFIEYVLTNYPDSTYWLTTHCQGDASRPIRDIGNLFDEKTVELMKRIKPTIWLDSSAKTDAIDFTKPFLWFDDDLINLGTVLCAAVFIEFLQSFPIPINEIHFN